MILQTKLLYRRREQYSDFALGFGLGSKWIHKKRICFEINADRSQFIKQKTALK
jgi:hypothetical protein